MSMIIHRHDDGSEGYEYEVQDRVIVTRTIQGGWFNIGPTTSEACTVEAIDGDSWRTAMHKVRYSSEWGPAECFPWHLTPAPEVLASATIVRA
jgi:hypothetical protein